MLTPGEKERLGSEICRTLHEALDLEDLGSQVLPLFDRLLDTSTSLLYRCNENNEIIPIAGSMSESIPYYSKNYFFNDPLQKLLISTNPMMLHSSSMPNWKEYLSSAAYNECATQNKIDNFLHLRISKHNMYAPGMVGMMVARTFRQPDFSEQERILIAGIMPTLEAFTRRNERLDERLKKQPFIESLFEFNHRPTIVMNIRGGFMWASDRAETLLKISVNGGKKLPKALEKAAVQVGALLRKNHHAVFPPATVLIPRENDTAIRAELRLSRERNGEHFVVAELEDPRISPRLTELAKRHGLTKTEIQVFHLISLGLSDREIGKRLFVSLATVHSHVNHILGKLAVNSRVKAALIAHGQTV